MSSDTISDTMTTASLQDIRIPVPLKLAAAWTSFMFLYVYVDILGLYMPGVPTNVVVATAYVVVSAGNAIGESWSVYFALAIGLETVVLGVILRTAWTWPGTTSVPTTGQPQPTGHDHPTRSRAFREAWSRACVRRTPMVG